MNALLKKVHDEVRGKVRAFAEEKVKPFIGDFESREEFPVELIKSMKCLDVFGMQAPIEYGGQGSDYLSFIIAVEELARVDSSVAATLAAHNSLGVGPILAFGTDEQKQKYIPALCTAENLWAFGLTEENAGSDAQGVETLAEEKDGKWLVNGHKKYITNAASEISSGISFVAQTGMRPDGKKEFTAFFGIKRNTWV